MSTHKADREYHDLNWLFYVRNIFVLFRTSHDLMMELAMIEAVFEGRPVPVPEPLEIAPPPQLPPQTRYIQQPPIGTPRNPVLMTPSINFTPVRCVILDL